MIVQRSLFDEFAQTLKSGVPFGGNPVKVTPCVLKTATFQLPKALAPAAIAVYKTRLFENAQMLGNCLTRDTGING